MKLCNLDRHPEYPSAVVGPLGLCLQWLDTLTKSPSVNWNPEQLAQAKANLRDAWTLMFTDVGTLAGLASVARDDTPPQPASPAEGYYSPEGVLRALSLTPGYLGLAPADEAAGCTIRAVAVQPLHVVKPTPKTRAEVLAAIDRAEEETAAAIRAQEAATPAPQTVYAALDLRGEGVEGGEFPKALADRGYTAEGLEADNPHNAWVKP